MNPRTKRVQALEAAQKPQEAPPSPVVLYTPGEPLPQALPAGGVVIYLPENGR